MALEVGPKGELLDGFLEFLGRAEGDFLAGLDLDRFAGGGIAAHAGGALADLKDAEADDADAFALLEVLGDLADHVGQDGFGALLGQFMLVRESRRQMLERNGGLGRCFLRHIWPSSLVLARSVFERSGYRFARGTHQCVTWNPRVFGGQNN